MIVLVIYLPQLLIYLAPLKMSQISLPLKPIHVVILVAHPALSLLEEVSVEFVLVVINTGGPCARLLSDGPSTPVLRIHGGGARLSKMLLLFLIHLSY